MDVASIVLGPLGATLLIGITTLLLSIWYSARCHSYWKKRNVPFVKPLPLVGSIFATLRKPIHEVELERYKKFGLIYGHFEGNRPVISVADPKMLRDILVKDFPSFSSRRTIYSGDPILDNMVSNSEGEDWKRVRTIITPAFSTGKLKRMLGIFSECSRTLVQNFKRAAEKDEPVNLKVNFGGMAMDVIASAAFSTKIDSFNDPQNKFVLMAKKAFGSSFSFRFIFYIFLPSVSRFFGISPLIPSVMNFFKSATLEIVKERRRLKQTRNDFLQLLIDTADEVAKQEKWDVNEKEADLASNYGQEAASLKVFSSSVTKSLSMDELVAQCVLFFLAGYDTTGTTMSFATYFLALNPDVQEIARQEIKDCLAETNGELNYEAVQNMKYLDNIISETLRLCPPAGRLERKAETDYQLGDTGITIPKGMITTIPNYALHKDERYFPDPDKFDPNRFTTEERAKRDQYAYLPFGAGPRNCVGMRFALLEVKTSLIHVISNFNIKTCKETLIPMKFRAGPNLLVPHDIYLKMEVRNDSPIIQ